jgi:small subunit ribosomal protein S6
MAKKKKSGNAQYEAMFLLGNPGEGDHAINLCRGIIERHGGEILLIKKWDERKLAYEIGKHKRGTYILAYFKAPGAAIAQIERDVNLSEEVLRVLVLRADHLSLKEMEEAEPQPVQVREERPDREFGGADRAPRREDRPRQREEAEAGAAKE